MGAGAKVAVTAGSGEGACAEAITLAEVFPERWTALVRSAPLQDVQPFGTRPSANPIKPPKFGVP